MTRFQLLPRILDLISKGLVASTRSPRFISMDIDQKSIGDRPAEGQEKKRKEERNDKKSKIHLHWHRSKITRRSTCGEERKEKKRRGA